MITGRCLCGAVRYRAEGPVTARSLCHCESCRRAAGGGPVAWTVVTGGEFEWIGEPSRFASSPGVERTFCPRCGSALTYRDEGRPTAVDITTVSLDDPGACAPTKEIFTAERLSWSPPVAGLDQFAGSSVAKPKS